MLRVMWRKGDSSLRRIYPSWEELEANLDIMVEEQRTKPAYAYRSCPNCGVTLSEVVEIEGMEKSEDSKDKKVNYDKILGQRCEET